MIHSGCRAALAGALLVGSVCAHFLALCSFAAEPALKEQKFTFLTQGRLSGQQIVKSGPQGTDVFFEFNDRGRGVKLDAQIRVDSRGVVVGYTGLGNDYMKNAVDEKFEFAGGVSRWKSAKESGSKAAKEGPAGFYFPADGPPEMSAVLARALLASPDRRLALLPDGAASIQEVGSLEIDTPAGRKKISQFAITGLELEPTNVWLDEHGQLFASVSSWFSLIVEGQEALIPRLLEIQDASATARRKSLAQTLARVPAEAGLLIKNARLFDSIDGTVRPHMSVLLKGNRIAAVGPDGTVLVPAGAEEMDVREQFLMPGLWDSHAHLDASDGLLHIANGVTTVRDLGNDYDTLSNLVARLDSGQEIGPRVFMAGLIDAHGPLAGPTKQFVDNEDDARRVVAWLADHGYVQLKIYSSISPKLVPLLAELAHARGMRVSGHVPAFMTASEFVRAGADEIQHINFIFLNFLFDSVKDTRAMARFSAVAERAGSIDPNGAKEREFIALLQERHTVVDPTVGVFEGMFEARPDQVAPGLQPIAGRLPTQVRRSLLGGGLVIPKEKAAQYAAATDALLRFLLGLHKAGVPMVPGTDGFAGFAMHRELELYVRAGIPAAEVLQMATIGAARVMGADRNLGRIAAGTYADLILIAGDPTKNISDIRHVRTVIKDGRIFDSAELCRALGIRPDDAASPTK